MTCGNLGNQSSTLSQRAKSLAAEAKEEAALEVLRSSAWASLPGDGAGADAVHCQCQRVRASDHSRYSQRIHVTQPVHFVP
jgi:hypothetical protein